jgi:hypothetical protein
MLFCHKKEQIYLEKGNMVCLESSLFEDTFAYRSRTLESLCSKSDPAKNYQKGLAYSLANY